MQGHGKVSLTSRRLIRLSSIFMICHFHLRSLTSLMNSLYDTNCGWQWYLSFISLMVNLMRCVHVCCQECTDAQKDTFTSCTPGVFGGQGRGTDLRSCKSAHFPKDDWFPLMCVQFETNAHLGEFYQNTDKLTSGTAITSAVAGESNLYSYR